MKRRDFLKLSTAAAALTAGAPLARRSFAQSAKTVRVGMVQSLSGGLSAYAHEGQPVFEYMVKKINEAGGIKSLGGAKLEIVLADDASKPAQTASEARRLVTEEKVDLLVGTILSAQMLALSPVLDELKVPALSIWAGGAKSEYLYSLGFPYDRGYAQTMSDFVTYLVQKKDFKLKTVVSAYSNYEAGQKVNEYLVPRLKAAGFEHLGDVPIDTKAQDQTSAMVRIRSMKPDLVMGLVTPRDGILLHQARFNLNYHGSLFVGGTGGYTDLSIWKELGPDICRQVLTRNLFGMTGFSPGAKMDSMQAILKELEAAKLGVSIGQGAIQAAQAARIVQQALEKAGSTDPKAIHAAFAKVEIPFGSPDLYLARPKGLAFGEDRMLTDGSAMMIQWQPDQTQQVVYPEAFAQEAPRPRA